MINKIHDSGSRQRPRGELDESGAFATSVQREVDLKSPKSQISEFTKTLNKVIDDASGI